MINRMSRETLDAMWAAVEGAGPACWIISGKGRTSGPGWPGLLDVSAPVGETQKTYTYEEGAQFVLEQFGKFSQDMAELAAKAFRERWIEAEDRPGSAWCFLHHFPKSKASRVFMTLRNCRQRLHPRP